MKAATQTKTSIPARASIPDRYINLRIDYMMECFPGAVAGAFWYFVGLLALGSFGIVAEIILSQMEKVFLATAVIYLFGSIGGLILILAFVAILSIAMTWICLLYTSPSPRD